MVRKDEELMQEKSRHDMVNSDNVALHEQLAQLTRQCKATEERAQEFEAKRQESESSHAKLSEDLAEVKENLAKLAHEKVGVII